MRKLNERGKKERERSEEKNDRWKGPIKEKVGKKVEKEGGHYLRVVRSVWVARWRAKHVMFDENLIIFQPSQIFFCLICMFSIATHIYIYIFTLKHTDFSVYKYNYGNGRLLPL